MLTIRKILKAVALGKLNLSKETLDYIVSFPLSHILCLIEGGSSAGNIVAIPMNRRNRHLCRVQSFARFWGSEEGQAKMQVLLDKNLDFPDRPTRPRSDDNMWVPPTGPERPNIDLSQQIKGFPSKGKTKC